MNIFRNDRVVLIKEFENMKQVGNEYEVANITETAVVLRDAKTKVAICAVNIPSFEEYFKKQEDVTGWTKWQGFSDETGKTVGVYRTNFRKVQVRINGGIQGEASCNRTDEFNLFFGINLAYLRAEQKFLFGIKDECEHTLANACSDLLENRNMMKRILRKCTERTKAGE